MSKRLKEVMALNEGFGNEITNIFNCDVLYGESTKQCICYPNETQTTTNQNTSITQTHTNNSSQFCKQNIHYTTNAKHFASTWLILTTTPTTLILLFTLFSILININRFDYPTRPILYMLLSHLQRNSYTVPQALLPRLRRRIVSLRVQSISLSARQLETPSLTLALESV